MRMKKNKEILKEMQGELKNNQRLLEDIKQMLHIVLEEKNKIKEENFWKANSVQEYEKLLWNNLTSRISILEEESEIYQKKESKN